MHVERVRHLLLIHFIWLLGAVELVAAMAPQGIRPDPPPPPDAETPAGGSWRENALVGHYYHAPSGLHLAFFRAYDADLARWLSRDPIGEEGGINLYGYVKNNPVSLIDPFGLTWSSNLSFLYQWLTGSGSDDRYYGSGTTEGDEMSKSPGANRLRDRFRKDGCKGSTFDYGSWTALFDTLIDEFGADWSSTSAQVGGFAGATAVNNGNGTVTYTIVNVAGTRSFFFHAVPDRNVDFGHMRNIEQTFSWTEKLPCANGK